MNRLKACSHLPEIVRAVCQINKRRKERNSIYGGAVFCMLIKSLEFLLFFLPGIFRFEEYPTFRTKKMRREIMDVGVLMQYITDYGWIAIFVIVLLEYLNLPGFPAGVIMPLAGLWAAQGNINFTLALMITVAAGLTGSIILYVLGRKGGGYFLTQYYRRFPKHQKVIESKIAYLQQKGSVGIFVSKLIPMVRTLISIPAGVIRMDFAKYCISSTLGIIVWNLMFVGAGYLFGDKLLFL